MAEAVLKAARAEEWIRACWPETDTTSVTNDMPERPPSMCTTIPPEDSEPDHLHKLPDTSTHFQKLELDHLHKLVEQRIYRARMALRRSGLVASPAWSAPPLACAGRVRVAADVHSTIVGTRRLDDVARDDIAVHDAARRSLFLDEGNPKVRRGGSHVA